MELGFHFDDELFENPSERSLKKEEITYQPKWCEKEVGELHVPGRGALNIKCAG